MMVQGSHAKYTLAGQLERTYLDDYRERFEHKHAANRKQQNFLFDDYGHHSNGPTESDSTDVTHKHFGGMSVVPEKTERAADQRAAKNHQFAGLRNFLNVEIVREFCVAAQIGKHGERGGRNQDATDGEAIETIGEIHGVRTADDHQHQKKQQRNEGQRPNVTMVV